MGFYIPSFEVCLCNLCMIMIIISIDLYIYRQIHLKVLMDDETGCLSTCNGLISLSNLNLPTFGGYKEKVLRS